MYSSIRMNRNRSRRQRYLCYISILVFFAFLCGYTNSCDITPVIVANPESGDAPLTVEFDASQSTGSPDLEKANIQWDPDGDDIYEFTGITAVYTYENPGTYTARLRINIINEAEKLIMVNDPGSPGHSFAYIANYGSDTVSIIDTDDQAVVKTIQVGSQPFGVAISPDGTKVFISCYGDDAVYVINTFTQEVSCDPIEVDNLPRGMALSPDGSLLYVACDSGSVDIIDTSDYSILESVSICDPYDVAVAPDGSHVFVTSESCEEVYVGDALLNRERTIELEVDGVFSDYHPEPHGIAIHPDGETAYVAASCAFSNDLFVIDAVHFVYNDNDVLNPGQSPYAIALTPDGLLGYISCEDSDDVYVLDAVDDEIVGGSIFGGGEHIDVGGKPQGISVTPEGDKVFVACADDDNVYVIDVSDYSTTSVPVGDNPISLGNFITPRIFHRVIGQIKLGGAGVSDVEVTLISESGINSTASDANGYFYLYLPNGEYEISLAKDGYAFSPASVPIKVVDRDFIIQDMPKITYVSISAEPKHITQHESTVLVWNAINADSVTIEPGLGSFGPEGSLEVSPDETTTYTIYATGPGGTAIDTVEVIVGSKITYFHNDMLGNTVAQTDSDGEVVMRAVYYPYGSLDDHAGAQESHLFTGKERDETGLDYFGARFYDPSLGRFLSVDPVGGDSMNPQTWNRYAYCLNNPYKYVDPDGEFVDTIVDIAFIVNDIRHIYNEGFTRGNIAALGGDIGGAIIPGLTGVGLGIRGSIKVVDKGSDAVKVVKNATKKSKIKWCQESERWRDVATGKYTVGPKIPKPPFGKPSTWVEETKDVTHEMFSTEIGEKAYENLQSTAEASDLLSAVKAVLMSKNRY